MADEDRRDLFDDWAPRYDRDVGRAQGFPFDGYHDVLAQVIESARAESGMSVLDLGTGTANLAKPLVDRGCRVCGVDASSEMLELAAKKVPDAKLLQMDLLAPWPHSIDGPYDRVVSGYVFHEFDDRTKVELVCRATDRLASDGRIVIGDIAFRTVEERRAARELAGKDWDEEEHYWAAEDALRFCAPLGLEVRYKQISSCAGVFVLTHAVTLH